MGYLLLSVSCGVLISVLFKYSEKHNLNRYVITSTNYLAAFMTSLGMFLARDLVFELGPVGWRSFFSEWRSVMLDGVGKFSPEASTVFALLLGILTGFLYFIGIIYMQLGIRSYGAGITGTFSRAGIIIPIISSALLWAEFPTAVQWIGIVLALIGIIVINMSSQEGQKFEIHLPLIIIFVSGGFSSLASKTFQMYAQIEYKSLFLFFIFLSAFFISIYYTFKTSKTFGLKDIGLGVAVGVPNMLSASFLLLALNVLPASIVYTMSSAGTVILINIIGVMLFKEKLAKKEVLAIGLTVIALIFINY